MTLNLIRLTPLIVFLLSSLSFAWTPMKFEIYCGEPLSSDPNYANATQDEPLVAQATSIEDFYSPQFYQAANAKGYDPDSPGNPDCLSEERKQKVASYASEILLALKQMGFASPSPDRLGPVIATEQGNIVRIYASENITGVANTLDPCNASGKHKNYLSIIRFNKDIFDLRPAAQQYYTLAHELVHVVQNAQSFVRQSDNCLVPGWLAEGTADAIANHLTQKRFNYTPDIATGIGKNMHSLRPYNKNLAWKNNSALPDYRTSSFWRYLAERYYDNDYSYLARYFATPDDLSGSDDWFAWLDKLLETDPEGPQKSLYLIYPDFMADYANWGTDKFSYIGEANWVKTAFDGCHTVTLSPQQPKQGLNLDLEPLSAQCIKVHVDGLNPGEVASVKTMAFEDDITKMDNLHLSAAYMKEKVVSFGGALNCYKEGRKVKQPLCLNKPFTAKKPSLDTTNSGGFSKTWLTNAQETTDGSIENMYLLTYSPDQPSDVKHANQVKQSVRLTFALDRSTLATSKGKALKVEGTANQLGTTGALDQIPMTSGNIDEAPVDIFVDPEATSQLLFNMNTPGTFFGSEGGLTAVVISEVSDVGAYLEPKMSLIMSATQPIPFGATGTFLADIQGAELNNPEFVFENVADDPSGSITVIEFSEDLLYIKISGQYCYHPILDVKKENCQLGNFEGAIIKPFGWVYDGAQGFSSIDTPGMEIYRKALYSDVFVDLFNLPAFPGESTDSSPPATPTDSTNNDPVNADSDSGVIDLDAPCECSCEEFNLFISLRDQTEEEQDTELEDLLFQRGMQCMMPCALAYAECTVE